MNARAIQAANGRFIAERLQPSYWPFRRKPIVRLKNSHLLATLSTMITVTALEAKTRFGKLLDRVARGEEVVVTRHDKPVARMIPAEGRALSAVRQGVAQLQQLQTQIRARTRGKASLSDDEVRTAIEEGRR
jgi:prevent-host-death family protein